jgi:hypothetical protein
MKSVSFAAIVLAAIVASPAAEAQTGTCRATVTARPATESQVKEKTWDIIFDVAAPSCDASRGTFEYSVNVTTSGRPERIVQTEEFTTADGKRTAVKVSFHARPGQEVVDVTGVTVRECSCQPNR